MRKRSGLLWFAAVFVVVAAVVAVALVYALRVDENTTSSPEPAPPTVVQRVNPVAATAPVPTPAGIVQQIKPALANPDIADVTGQITDAATGRVLWSHDPDEKRTPASTTKLLTVSAALLALPPDATLTTNVVQGPGGQLILVGAGDPTLSVQPEGQPTFYTDAPRISALAEQIRAKGLNPASIAIDTSAFTGSDWDSTWDREDIAGGNLTPIQSLIADGGRLQPLKDYSPRTPTPALDAGKALAADLGVSGAVTPVTAPVGAPVVASVKSAPLLTRLGDMIRDSDNILAETVSIEIARATGGQPSLAGGVAAVRNVLTSNGFDLGSTVLHDTSGMSTANLISPDTLDKVLLGAASGQNPKLRPLLDMLAIGGVDGTLSDRFATNGVAGWVRAKTGTLTGVNTLAGIVQDTDGRVLTFALMAGGDINKSRMGLDAVASALRGCGCQ